MRTNVVANPQQIAILSRVVAHYCRNNAVVDRSERERVGRRVLALYAQGIRNETELVLRLLDNGTIH